MDFAYRGFNCFLPAVSAFSQARLQRRGLLMAFKGRPEEEEEAPEMESDERMPAKNECARASVCVVGVVKG